MSITKVQEVFSYTAAGGSATKNITIANPTAGNALRLVTRANPGKNITAVKCGSTDWTKIADYDNAHGHVYVWDYPNATGSETTVAITMSDSYARTDANVTEWSAMPTVTVTDGNTTNTGSGATETTASITPTAGNPLVILAVGGSISGSTTNTPSGGFTALTTTGGSGSAGMAYLIVASASGNYSTSWPVQHSYTSWDNVIVGFDGAAAGGTVGAPYYQELIGGGTHV